MYIFYSVVVRADYFRNAQLRRDVAYRAWRKNALKDLVGFAFDERRQLVGTIEQPVETLDHEELQLYIDVLAKECDRFEYVLTGRDIEQSIIPHIESSGNKRGYNLILKIYLI